jgi:hypothetical protein
MRGNGNLEGKGGGAAASSLDLFPVIIGEGLHCIAYLTIAVGDQLTRMAYIWGRTHSFNYLTICDSWHVRERGT